MYIHIDNYLYFIARIILWGKYLNVKIYNEIEFYTVQVPPFAHGADWQRFDTAIKLAHCDPV